MTKTNYFSWYDCWVITGLLWTTPKEAEIDLSAIITTGDMLNHAIYTAEELKRGFFKAQKRGLIQIRDNKIILTDKGEEIRAKVQAMRGGQFSIVNNMHKKLNSIRTKLTETPDEEVDPCGFINENSVKESYDKYHSIYNKGR